LSSSSKSLNSCRLIHFCVRHKAKTWSKTFNYLGLGYIHFGESHMGILLVKQTFKLEALRLKRYIGGHEVFFHGAICPVSEIRCIYEDLILGWDFQSF
jgi:hypothetical protein